MIHDYWQAVLRQDEAAMCAFLHPDATVCWHNTNEQFTAEEFIRANCEYPGQWAGEIERIEAMGDLLVTAVHVYEKAQHLSFHVTSFIRLREGRIGRIDEYWGDDGPPPEWRRQMSIGKPMDAE